MFNNTIGFNIEAKKTALYSLKYVYFVFWNTEIEWEGHTNEQDPKSLQKHDCGGIHLPSELIRFSSF